MHIRIHNRVGCAHLWCAGRS